MCVHTAELPVSTDRQTEDGQTDELIWWGLGNLRFLQVKIFLIAQYPQPLIGPYDYGATPAKEYNLMSNEVRNRILKASPHARIRRQIGINKINERNRRLSSYQMHLHHQTYLTM